MSELSPIEVNVVPDSAVSLAKEIYEDGAKPLTSEAGKLLGRIPRFINAALISLDKWMLHREFNYSEVQLMLEQKLKNVSPEKLIEPEPYVAVPALQAISYSLNSENLTNMYANLLAKSMVIDKKDEVHPAFVEIIKQLSPLDARVFSELSNDFSKPIVDIHLVENNQHEYKVIATNLVGLEYDAHHIMSSSIDNLVRLGLFQITDSIISGDDTYQTIFNTVQYSSLINFFKDPTSLLVPKKKCLHLNDMGYLFRLICINDSIVDKTSF